MCLPVKKNLKRSLIHRENIYVQNKFPLEDNAYDFLKNLVKNVNLFSLLFLVYFHQSSLYFPSTVSFYNEFSVIRVMSIQISQSVKMFLFYNR